MMSRRRLLDLAFCIVAGAAALAIVAVLVSIIAVIVKRGIGAMSWDLLTKTPAEGTYSGGGGGIANAIIGSIYIGGGATLIALVVSLPAALYLRVYARRWFAGAVRALLDVLWGVPSIVFGAFGFTVMLAMGWRASLLAGTITVALFELPILIRAIDEVLKLVPPELEESSYVLGATRGETAFRVVARQAMLGIISGTLLAFGRGVGDAASVLFTAGFTDRVPQGLFDPAATLPLTIFFQLGTPFEEAHKRAYGAAFILVVLVLVTSIVSRVAGALLGKHTVK